MAGNRHSHRLIVRVGLIGHQARLALERGATLLITRMLNASSFKLLRHPVARSLFPDSGVRVDASTCTRSGWVVVSSSCISWNWRPVFSGRVNYLSQAVRRCIDLLLW